jgi:uncharacterized protein (DUF885 family)
MKRTRYFWGVLAAMLVVAVAVWGVKLLWLRPFNIDHFFERAYISFLWNDPENLTSTGVLDPYFITGHQQLLSFQSPQRSQELAELGRKNLRLLQGYNRASLAQGQQVSYDIFEWFLQTGVAGEPFLFHDYPITHLSGAHLELPQFMQYAHPMASRKDAANYNLRLGQVGEKFGHVVDALAYRNTKGIVAPTFILQKAIAQCDAFVSTAPEENVLYTSFAKRLATLAEIEPAVQAQLLAECKTHIIEVVYPAYKRLSGYLLQLEQESMAIAGTWHLPNGDAYYRFCLLQNTTLPLDPEQLYALGKLEMARIEGEMRIVANLMGYGANTDMTNVLHQLSAQKQPRFTTDALGRKACLQHFEKTIDAITPKLSNHFAHLPHAPLEVHEVPQNRANAAMLAFYLPPKGNPLGPGRLFVNTHKADQMTPNSATTYAYHEGLPGHHLQKAMQLELEDVPQFRKFLPFEAFTEGWAMYAEELGHEISTTENPLDRLALLQSDLFRTARMITDVGIHHKKWQRDQAIRFMQQHAGLSPEEAELEVDRYIIWPGQGCAYKIGKMKFLELRDKVRAAKGKNYDPKVFHHLLIGQGAMPLQVLENRVNSSLKNH